MKIEAKAFARGKMGDLFEATGNLQLTARNEEEAKFLAAMVRALSGGGEVKVEFPDGKHAAARRDDKGEIHMAKPGEPT